MTHNQNGPAFPFRSGKQKRGPWRVVLLVLGSASFALLLVVHYWCLQSLLDDSAFLHQASASAQGIVSAVSTSVLPGGDGPAVVLCREKVTFLPAGTRPITLTSEGAEQSFVGTGEKCSEPGDHVRILYAPSSPADARVAEVVHDDLIVSLVRECFFGLFTLAFVGSGGPLLGAACLYSGRSVSNCNGMN